MLTLHFFPYALLSYCHFWYRWMFCLFQRSVVSLPNNNTCNNNTKSTWEPKSTWEVLVCSTASPQTYLPQNRTTKKPKSTFFIRWSCYQEVAWIESSTCIIVTTPYKRVEQITFWGLWTFQISDRNRTVNAVSFPSRSTGHNLNLTNTIENCINVKHTNAKHMQAVTAV